MRRGSRELEMTKILLRDVLVNKVGLKKTEPFFLLFEKVYHDPFLLVTKSPYKSRIS